MDNNNIDALYCRLFSVDNFFIDIINSNKSNTI